MEQDNILGKKCTCKRGFFVIRQCGRPAIARCALTHQPICDECSVDYENQKVSREAYVEEMKKQGKTQTYNKNNAQNYYYDNDPVLWYYFMRDDFYHSHSYQPFNDFDSGSFNDSSEFGGGEFGGAGASGSWDDESGVGSMYDS